jgi:hypothetical protein
MKILLIIYLMTQPMLNMLGAMEDHSDEGISLSPSEGMIDSVEFAHVVLFWLKSPDNQADRDSFRTSLEKFVNQSTYIKSMHLGEPSSTNRSVVDRSYTYIMILKFASKEDQDKYQEESGHKLFIAESEELWEKVVVYDSENLW